MKRNLIYLTILCFVLILFGQGCAYNVSQIRKQEGMVEVGMNKEDVLAVWGKPYHKWLQEQSIDSNVWLYPGKHWWGANQIELKFDESGILK